MPAVRSGGGVWSPPEVGAGAGGLAGGMRTVRYDAFDYRGVDAAACERAGGASAPSIAGDDGGAAMPCGRCALVLNNTLPRCFAEVWEGADLRVAADGGADRVIEAFARADDDGSEAWPPPRLARAPPDGVIGDLDSITPRARALFASPSGPFASTEVVDLHHDQDSTDMDKCFKWIARRAAHEGRRYCVFVLGAFGGRFDHEMANLNVVVRLFEQADSAIDAFLVGGSPCTVATILRPGLSRIILHSRTLGVGVGVGSSEGWAGVGCALMPVLGGACVVTTRGLRWDMTNQEMRFGALVSTSNHAVGMLPNEGERETPGLHAHAACEECEGNARAVLVETDRPAVWVITLASA